MDLKSGSLVTYIQRTHEGSVPNRLPHPAGWLLRDFPASQDDSEFWYSTQEEALAAMRRRAAKHGATPEGLEVDYTAPGCEPSLMRVEQVPARA